MKRQAPTQKAVKLKLEKKVPKTGVTKIKPAHSKLLKGKTRAKTAHKKVKRAPKTVQAKAFYCAEVGSNRTLLARNPDRQLPVASLTKLVTALVALDSMPRDRVITVPDHIKKVPKSVVGLKPGDKIPVGELLHGLLIGSGNDCAETLACAYPGGKEKFVEAMNKRAQGLGTNSTVFYTPSGLDRKVAAAAEGDEPEIVDSNVSTAREIARIAKEAFSNPTIRSICRKQSYLMASQVVPKGYAVRNTNKLLRDNLPVVGGKTGYTSRAGHCLATELAPETGLFLIVVLGSPDHFADTRLVYHKALAESGGVKTTSAPTTAFKRMAARPDYSSMR